MFCAWVLVLSFCGNLVGGSFGYGRPGGVNTCFGFSHSRSVWVKEMGHRRGKQNNAFSILSWFLFLYFFCSGLVFVCFGIGFVLLLDCCWWCSCFFFAFLSLLSFLCL